MLKTVSFNYQGEKINISVKNCDGLRKILGLMFKVKDTNALLFDFNHQTNIPIHSFFVFFPFVAVWLDDKNHVIEVKRIEPFTLSAKPKRQYKRLIEIPINTKNSRIINSLISRR